MTRPPEDSDSRDSISSADSVGDDANRSSNIYRRPRQRSDGDTDLRSEMRDSPPNPTRNQESESERADGIYAPPRRRSVRRGSDDPKPGIFSRLTGRHRLDEIREARYQPYTYESNAQNLRWTAVVMGIWCLVLVWLAFTD